MDKRTFIKTLVLTSAGLSAIGTTTGLKAVTRRNGSWNGEFLLPPLKFPYHALEPYFDAENLAGHHAEYHAALTNQINNVVQNSGLKGKTAYQLLTEISKYDRNLREAAGGYFNHKMFWNILTVPDEVVPGPDLVHAFVRHFGSVEIFKDQFVSAARSVYGSGWAWLVADSDALMITASEGNDNPLMDVTPQKGIPLLCLDTWDHALGSRYKNDPEAYVDAFWHIVNWKVVERRYQYALKS